MNDNEPPEDHPFADLERELAQLLGESEATAARADADAAARGVIWLSKSTEELYPELAPLHGQKITPALYLRIAWRMAKGARERGDWANEEESLVGLAALGNSAAARALPWRRFLNRCRCLISPELAAEQKRFANLPAWQAKDEESQKIHATARENIQKTWELMRQALARNDRAAAEFFLNFLADHGNDRAKITLFFRRLRWKLSDCAAALFGQGRYIYFLAAALGVMGAAMLYKWSAPLEAKAGAMIVAALAGGLLLRVDLERYCGNFSNRVRGAFSYLAARGLWALAFWAASVIVSGLVDPDISARDVFNHTLISWNMVLPWVSLLLQVCAIFVVAVIVWNAVVFLLFNYGGAERSGADAVRDQTTYGDAKPADPDALHTALQGKSADGRKRSAKPSHDFDYPD